ncbi:MAG TPA: helicase-associated domain-containing protein [Kocuria rosea]|nr:helicase-associated domain-containing protein [Kocuria rosea]
MLPDGLLRDLASRSPAELGELLAARPDLVRPGTASFADLAEALLARAGQRRALDELTRPELDAVERAVVLGMPADPAAQLLAGPPWRRLHRLGLVHRDGQALRLVPGVADGLGRYPAGLGRPRSVLEPLAERLRGRLPQPAGAAAPAEALLGDPDATAWPAGAREVLERFRGRPVGALPDALRRPDPAVDAAARPVDWLLARGVLLPVDSRHVELPREVGLALHGGDPWARQPEEPPGPPGRRVPDRLRDNAAAAAVEQLLRLLAVLRAELAARPLTTLRAGGVGVRELRRLRAALDVEPAELARLLGTAELAGLVRLDPDTSAWRPAPAPFEDADRSRQWLHVVRCWLASDVVPSAVGRPLADGSVVGVLTRGTRVPEAVPVRRAVLEAHAGLAERAPGAHGAEDVLALARRRRPRLARSLDRWGPGMLTEAAELGLVGADALTAPGRAVARGRVGDAADAVAHWLPAPGRTVLLQSDLTATAPGHLAPDVARALGQLAEAEGHGPAARHRFTEQSLHRALDAGWSAATILGWLEEHGTGPVPQALAYLVEETGRGHGRLRITRADWVVTGEEDLLEALARAPRLAGRPVRRPAPGVLVVAGGEEPTGRRRSVPGRDGVLGELVAAARATGTEPALDVAPPGPEPVTGGADPAALLEVLEVPAAGRPGPSPEEVRDLLARLVGDDAADGTAAPAPDDGRHDAPDDRGAPAARTTTDREGAGA